MALALPAWAARVDDDLDGMEPEVQDIVTASEQLDRQVAPGRGFITEDQAVERYQENVYLHLVGEYEAAAEGFFTLVTTVALDNAGLHWDAEWYLAESLYKMGNLGSATRNYRVIIEDFEHPFRDDAVRRLLEIYVDLGDTEEFYGLYNREIVANKVRPSDMITYSVGKSFFRQGDYLQAKSNLGDIAADSPYRRKAEYILGSIMVVEGNIEDAVPYFEAITKMSIETLEDRQLLDLSLLALGRIYLELGSFDKASEYYGRIGGDSDYLADKLYEQVWTFIKQKEQLRAHRLDEDEPVEPEEAVRLEYREMELIQEALRGVEIFLLAFPEHEYTAQLQLLQGHLHIQAAQHDAALDAYESVITSYTPVRERFGKLARSEEEPRAYFESLIGAGSGRIAGADGLPSYALAMVFADQDLSRALSVYRDIDRQRQNLDDSEAIIAELDKVLANSGGIGGFDTLRYNVSLNKTLALQKQMQLLEVEEQWLQVNTGGDVRRTLNDLKAQRAALAGEVLAVGGAKDPTTVPLRVAELRAGYRKLRSQTRDSDAVRVAARIDGIHTSLEHAVGLLTSAESGLGDLELAELDRIKRRFDREVRQVERQREELEQTIAEAEDVSIGLTRAGFGRLEDFFAASILRADVGVVDVYWAQKVEIAEEKTRVRQEQNELLEEIRRRFSLIEQKLRFGGEDD